MIALHRTALPQLQSSDFLTDGGIETSLIFLDGLDLPHFAAFTLLSDSNGRRKLKEYFIPYLEYAAEKGVGFVLESPTWRASPDWGDLLGYDRAALADANRAAIDLMGELRREYSGDAPIVVSGCIGPRGDGYNPAFLMSAAEAEDYHAWQIGVFADTEADMVTAITMAYPNEAIGIARASKAAGIPSAISLTTETDGKLPTGETISEALNAIDRATGSAPAYFMINCAHPEHFENSLEREADWAGRIRGIRANASTKSHAELDEATELDAGDPETLAQGYKRIDGKLPALSVFGGCCGTDHRHIRAIFEATRANA